MLTVDALKGLLHGGALSKTDKLLLCLACGAQPKAVKDVKAVAAAAGLGVAARWNLSQLLAGAKGRAISTPSGWELSPLGRQHVAHLAGTAATTASTRKAVELLAEIAKINSPDTRAFVEEAVTCLESKLYRAAVVFSWVGAMAILHETVVNKHLQQFNQEAQRRDPKWKEAKTTDDFGRMKEVVFLDVLAAISVIGKNVRTELGKCLDLRNGCGHPNSLKVGDLKAAAHVETLLQNVFAVP